MNAVPFQPFHIFQLKFHRAAVRKERGLLKYRNRIASSADQHGADPPILLTYSTDSVCSHEGSCDLSI